jgi:hypothetical protein
MSSLVEMNQIFNAPVETVFAEFANHERFGELLGVPMKLIKDGSKEPNGLGSVRQVLLGPLPILEETVVSYKENELIEYTITSLSPFKSHLGRLEFKTVNKKTVLNYSISAEPWIPFTELALLKVLELVINNALQNYANSLT